MFPVVAQNAELGASVPDWQFRCVMNYYEVKNKNKILIRIGVEHISE